MIDRDLAELYLGKAIYSNLFKLNQKAPFENERGFFYKPST